MIQMADWTFYGALFATFVAGWFVARLMYKRANPSQDNSVVPQSSFGSSGYASAELEKLVSLRNSGAITDDEYQKMKERVTSSPASASNGSWGASVPAPVVQPVLSDDWRAKIEAEIRAGRKIDAIKLYREATSVGLKEAKDTVEAMERGSVSLGSLIGSPRGSGSSATPVALSDAWRTQIESEIRAKHKINAIKLYREATGVGLKEAKDTVEEMERNMGF